MEENDEEKHVHAVVLQNSRAVLRARERAEEKLRESENRLREANAELAQRLLELQHANVEILESRRDALNLMEDAVRARQAITESEERFRSLVSVITDVSWTTDAEGRFIALQPAWQAFTGQTWDQQRDFGWANALHPDDRERVQALWQQALETIALCEFSGRLWHAPGGSYRHVVTRATALRDGNGRVREWVGSCTDVHERKQIEEARYRLAAIVESSDDAIISENLNGFITSWNRGAEHLFGYTPAEAIGQPVTMLIPPDHLDEKSSMLERVRRGESAAHYETVCRRKDGTLIDISLTESPVRDSVGHLVGASKVARDITGRKTAEAALQESARLVQELYDTAESARISAEAAKLRAETATRTKDEFLAALSHELRTPLNPALLLASALADDASLPPHIRTDIETIGRSISLQVELIDDLLDLTRITGGKLRLELQTMDAHEALRQTLEMVNREIGERRIGVTLDLAAARHFILADRVRMQQVFWNVLKNAIKFNPPGGSITVRTFDAAEGADAMVVEITDTGIGIEPGMLEKIFDSFAQEDHSEGHRFGGLGLGLAITRRLVEFQHGRINAQSSGRDRGATFRIELPLAPSGTVTPGGPGPAAPAATKPQARRILLVEDHEMTRQTLASLLQRRGHTVFDAGTAAQARALATTCDCDLVISDLGLPDCDGHTFMAAMRDAHGLTGIALSGYGAESDLRRSRESGFFTHLTKPVNIHALEAAIAAASSPRSAPRATLP